MDWIRTHRDTLRRSFVGAMLIGLAFFAWVGAGMYQKRKATEAMIAQRDHAAAQEADNGHFFSGQDVKYKGKTYRRNSYVKAILCIGVDRSGTMTEAATAGSGGQADGVFLVAQDTVRNKLRILMIPRDTMTDITMTDLQGTVLGVDKQHLTLAYAYGDGREKSCRYMVEAVSNLLGGLNIDYYMAADMDVISVLNDAVGGVTVTVPTEGMERRDPALTKGSRVTLHGKQAEIFVRFRDINRDNSALYRMNQQREYILRFFQTLQKKAAEDSRIVPNLFEQMQEHMITNMGKELYLKMAMDGLEGGGLTAEDIYTVPGTGITTEWYDEFHADEEALEPILLDLFFREAG